MVGSYLDIQRNLFPIFNAALPVVFMPFASQVLNSYSTTCVVKALNFKSWPMRNCTKMNKHLRQILAKFDVVI